MYNRISQHKQAAARPQTGHCSAFWQFISQPGTQVRFVTAAVVDSLAQQHTDYHNLLNMLAPLIEGTLAIYLDLQHRQWNGHRLDFTTQDCLNMIASIRQTSPWPMPSFPSASLNVAFPLLQAYSKHDNATPQSINAKWEAAINSICCDCSVRITRNATRYGLEAGMRCYWCSSAADAGEAFPQRQDLGANGKAQQCLRCRRTETHIVLLHGATIICFSCDQHLRNFDCCDSADFA